MTPPEPSAALLVERSAWMRRLARDLLGDAHAAEDVAQDVTVLALERGRGADAGWLAAVVRRRAAHRRREEGRRRWRERARVEERVVDSSAALLSRHELRAQVAAAVADLDEPYRSLLLRRYYEGQGPREIARLTGENPSTVRGRLQDGLGRLRAKLRRELGDERWGVALLPLAGARPTPWVATAGGAAAAVALAMFGFGGEERGAGDGPVGGAGAREVDTLPTRLSGRLLDETGRPLADAQVRVMAGAGIEDGSERGARTDEQGRFALDLVLERAARLRGTAYVSLRTGAAGHQPATLAYHFPPVTRGRDLLEDWVVLSGGCVRGTLVDRLGNRLVGERVWLNAAGFDRRVHGDGRGLAQGTETDADGRFELAIPLDGHWFLRTVAGPHGRAWRAGLVLDADEDLELGTLLTEELGVIAGTLVDAGGRGVEGGEVSVRHVETQKPWTTEAGDRMASAFADAQGRFRIAGLEPGEYSLRAGERAILVETGAQDLRVGRGPTPGSGDPALTLPEHRAADHRAARLTVVARRPGGERLAGVRVTLQRLERNTRVSGGSESYSGDLHSDGRSGPLLPGPVRVSVNAVDERSVERLRAALAGLHRETYLPPLPVEIELRAGEEQPVELDLLPAGWVRLITRRAAEEPTPAPLAIEIDGDRQTGTTLLGGRLPYLASVGDTCLVGPLLPGEHALVLSAPDFAPEPRTVVVEAHRVVTVEVELRGR